MESKIIDHGIGRKTEESSHNNTLRIRSSLVLYEYMYTHLVVIHVHALSSYALIVCFNLGLVLSIVSSTVWSRLRFGKMKNEVIQKEVQSSRASSLVAWKVQNDEASRAIIDKCVSSPEDTLESWASRAWHLLAPRCCGVEALRRAPLFGERCSFVDETLVW